MRTGNRRPATLGWQGRNFEEATFKPKPEG